MTLDQLRYYVAAAKFENLTRAAKSISISPSVISHAVASLESELGELFFHRIGKRLSLTAAGRDFHKSALGILEQIEALGTGLREKVTLKGQFRIAASHAIAARILTPAWSALQADHPRLTGEITATETRYIMGDVLSGRLDLGLCFSPVSNSALETIEVDRGQQVLAVRKKHPVRRKLQPNLAELSKYPAALHRVTEAHDIDRDFPVLKKHGIHASAVLLFDHGDIAVEKIIHSDAWSLIPDIVFHFHRRRIETFPIPATWNSPIQVAVIYRKERKGDPVLRLLIDHIRIRISDIRRSIAANSPANSVR